MVKSCEEIYNLKPRNKHLKKVSGFTFIKNGLTLGYPIKESIESIDPLCDEIVINVGFDDPSLTGDDGTEEYLRDHFKGSKYVFLKSWWDPSLTKSGLILSEQTNIALNACKGDICQYIQGDEAIHEDDLSIIEDGIKKLRDNKELEGLIYNYIHFFGSPDFYRYTRNIYRREVRTIKKLPGLQSFRDAQGFRFTDGRKPLSILTDARIFHYGWARQEQVMRTKIESFNKLYSDIKNKDDHKTFEFKNIYGIHEFNSTHPKHLNHWLKENRNDIALTDIKADFEMKYFGLWFSDLIEKYTDYRMGEFKNYKRKK